MKTPRFAYAVGHVDDELVCSAAASNTKKRFWLKWGSLAACFALILALGIGFFTNVGDNQIATLDNGTKISFVKSDHGIGQFDIAFQIETRDLTEAERKALFGELPVIAHAVFNAESQTIIGLEGKFNDMKLIVSAPGMMLKDTVIEGEEGVSDVNGVLVKAGYFISGNTVIYYATFALDGNTVYLENAGPKDEGESVKEDIATAIQDIIALEMINLFSIHK